MDEWRVTSSPSQSSSSYSVVYTLPSICLSVCLFPSKWTCTTRSGPQAPELVAAGGSQKVLPRNWFVPPRRVIVFQQSFLLSSSSFRYLLVFPYSDRRIYAVKCIFSITISVLFFIPSILLRSSLFIRVHTKYIPAFYMILFLYIFSLVPGTPQLAPSLERNQ